MQAHHDFFSWAAWLHPAELQCLPIAYEQDQAFPPSFAEVLAALKPPRCSGNVHCCNLKIYHGCMQVYEGKLATVELTFM